MCIDDLTYQRNSKVAFGEPSLAGSDGSRMALYWLLDAFQWLESACFRDRIRVERVSG